MSSRGSLVALARRMIDSGELHQALALCEEEVAQDGSDMELWSLVGEIQGKLGGRQQAIAAYRQAAHLAQNKGAADRAIASLKAILSMHPQDVLAQRAVAEVYRKQGQLNRAALAYEMAAQELAAQGRVHESLATVQLIVNMSPSNVGRRILLAEQYMKADMISAAVRELEAAAAYLHDTERVDEYARVVERLRILAPGRGEAGLSAAAPAGQSREATSSQTTSGPRQDAAPSSATIDSQPGLSAGGAGQEDASVYITEADTFLRLGLVTKAAEHLATALVRNPFLRNLREPLIKLYVAQGHNQEAVVELWKLIAQCADKQEEIRYLRYILRLDSRDDAARRRLSALAKLRPAEEAAAQGSESGGPGAMTELDSALRGALDSRRPPTDLAATVLVSAPATFAAPAHVEPQDHGDSGGWLMLDPPPPPSATTRPARAQTELLAEEIALSSRSFQDELAEIDHCLRQANYADARRRLQILAGCYPHSQLVRTQLGELESWSQVQPDPGDSVAAPPQPTPEPPSELVAAIAALNEPRPSQRTPTLTALLTRFRQSANRTTLEVQAQDIEEERSRLGPPPPPPRTLPPSARRQKLTHNAAVALLAYEGGARLHARGEHAAAIHELDKVLEDATYGARAALMIGLCLRAQERLPDAIVYFMRGVNMHWTSESDLSELFYELGATHEQLGDAKEAILFFQLALGAAGRFRDTAQRIAALQQSLRLS